MSDDVVERVITITVDILPIKDGKRVVMMAGAPAGEMPEMMVGTFPAMHAMLDQLWMTLRTRKPQVVKVKGQKDEAEKDVPEISVEAELAGDAANSDMDKAGAGAADSVAAGAGGGGDGAQAGVEAATSGGSDPGVEVELAGTPAVDGDDQEVGDD